MFKPFPMIFFCLFKHDHAKNHWLQILMTFKPVKNKKTEGYIYSISYEKFRVDCDVSELKKKRAF